MKKISRPTLVAVVILLLFALVSTSYFYIKGHRSINIPNDSDGSINDNQEVEVKIENSYENGLPSTL